MDYREYLQKQLGGIRDIEERKEARDPINGFWHPLCPADLNPGSGEGRKTIYLTGNDASVKAFLQQKQILGTEEKTGRRVTFAW